MNEFDDSEDFDPSAVPPADDFGGDPGEQELVERLAAARELLDGLRPATKENVTEFLAAEAVEAAAWMREHDLAYFVRLKEELRPHRVLRDWSRAVARAAADLDAGAQKIAEKTRLVGIGVDLFDLWHDGAEAWCSVKERGPGCSWMVSGADARRFLLRAYGERHRATLDDGRKVPMAPSSQAVKEALDQLEAIGHDGERRPEPALRVAGDGERIVLDLCRDDFAVVEVTASEWLARKASPLHLRRAEGMRPLPMPVSCGGASLGELRALLGLGDAEHDPVWALVLGFLFSCFRPSGGFPVLVLIGEQGAGKTTLLRVVRRIVDPHKVDVQPKPRGEEDLFVNGNGQWLICYDNLSYLGQEWSDAFCRIATGSGYAARKRYTDREINTFQVCRPQAITSIVDVAAAPDLLDRSLLVQLPDVTPKDRLDDAEIMAKVDELAPRCLGQLLDAAVVALRDQATVELREKPRMLGVARWVEAGAEVLGLWPEQFLDAYRDSQARAGDLTLESSVVGLHLRQMLDARDVWAAAAVGAYAGPRGFRGTAAQLLAELSAHLDRHGRRTPKGWPETARGLSGALRRAAPALRKLGYPVAFSLGPPPKRERMITIETPAFSFDGRYGRSDEAMTPKNKKRNAAVPESPPQERKGAGSNRPIRPHRPPNGDPRLDDVDGVDDTSSHNSRGSNARSEACSHPGCGHPACAWDSDGSAWCADHLEPWQRQAAVPPAFTPTPSWQDVPLGAVLPPGLQIRMDLGGRNQARLAVDCEFCHLPIDMRDESLELDGRVIHAWCRHDYDAWRARSGLAPPAP